MLELLYTKRRLAGEVLDCHEKTVELKVREGSFPPATLHLGPNSPRWIKEEIRRYLELLALTGDPHEATRRVLAERAERLAAA